MALESLVAIPSTFGTGGSGLNPTADPVNNLQNILQAFYNIVSLFTTNPEEISAAGALSASLLTSRVTISGSKAYTLADATQLGQLKLIYVVGASGTPSGVVTPAHGSGFSTITYGASSATSWHLLQWDASLGTPAWKIVAQYVVSGGTVTVA